jgi:hypothetical protein
MVRQMTLKIIRSEGEKFEMLWLQDPSKINGDNLNENGDLLANVGNISIRWKNYFSQLLNMHTVNDVRQLEIHTAESFVPDPSRLVVEISIAKLKKYKSPGSDQIPAELTQVGGEILLSKINKLMNSVWNKGELPDYRKESVGDPPTWRFCSGLPFVAASSHQPCGAPLDSAHCINLQKRG